MPVAYVHSPAMQYASGVMKTPSADASPRTYSGNVYETEEEKRARAGVPGQTALFTEDLRAQLAAQQPRGVPGTVTAAPIQATQAARSTPVVAAGLNTMPQVQAPTLAQAAQVGAAPVGGSRIGNVERFAGATVAPTTLAQAATTQGAQVVSPEQAAARALSMEGVGAVQRTLAGTAPSVAELQMQRGLERAIATQRGLAAGARGNSLVGAAQEAARNTAEIQQRAVGDRALLRAQEQAAARGELINAAQGLRGQDITLGTTNATLAQQAALQNAQLGTQVSTFNAGQGNEQARLQAQLEQQARAANAGAQNTMATEQARLDQGANTFSADQALRAALANQNAAQQTNLAQGQMTLQAAGQTAELGLREALANQGSANQVALANQGVDTQVSLANAQLGQQANLANQGADMQAQITNLDAALKARGLDDQQRATLIGAILQGSGQVMNYNLGKATADMQSRGQDLGFWSTIIGAGLGAAGTAATAGATQAPRV